jgi:hypothetical protein
MSDSVIINVRKQLHWQRRLFSDATTAALWGFWLWLCRPVIGVVTWLLGLGAGLQHSFVQLMALNAPVSLERTAAVEPDNAAPQRTRSDATGAGLWPVLRSLGPAAERLPQQPHFCGSPR